MESIRDTVKNLMQEWGSRKGLTPDEDPNLLLQKAFPKKDLPHIQFQYLRSGIMGVKVDSSARLYFLNLQKGLILKKLRDNSRSVIKDIRLSLGEISEKRTSR